MGLQASFIRYLEPGNQIALSELGLTGKYTAAYSLSSKVDISGSTFATLIPLTLSPTGLPPARFWGINGRIGYALPHPKAVFLAASVGYYIMGLYSSGGYGVSMASGPQLFLTAAAPHGARREWFGYFKFAALQASNSFSPSNHEIAVGGGVQVGHLWNRTLFGALDISQAGFLSPDGLNSLYWDTASLGLQLKL